LVREEVLQFQADAAGPPALVFGSQLQGCSPQRPRRGRRVPATGGVIGLQAVVAALPPAAEQLADGAGGEVEAAGQLGGGPAGQRGVAEGQADGAGKGTWHVQDLRKGRNNRGRDHGSVSSSAT
jgi:hypothetical protein